MNSTKIKRASLLIVEDDLDIMDILKEHLNPLCEAIYTAINGQIALQVVQRTPKISAVLSDLKMPEMGGLELLANLRRNFNPIPFVILTGFEDTQSLQEAIRLNATDFLNKPFQESQLIETMTRAIHYGVELAKVETELDALFESSVVPPGKLNLLRRAKRTVMAMRIENSIYVKKVSSS